MAFVYHQVFCDESGKYETDQRTAFSGVVATADRLRGFDEAWRALLRSYELSDLHMERASRLCEQHGYRLEKDQTVDERTDELIPFADLINKYLEIGFIQAWDTRGFNRIPFEARRLLGGSDNPFFLAFIRGLSGVADHIGEDDRINIICDDDQKTAYDMHVHYRALRRADTNVQRKVVSLTFADDKHFPALQAADMVAFLTKHEAAERFSGIPNMWSRLYKRLTTEPKRDYGIMRWFEMYAPEQMLVDFANELKQVAEQRRNEKQNAKRNRVREIRSANGATGEGSTQRDQGETGSGESLKKEAEG